MDSRELKEKMKTWEYERLSKSYISLRKKLIDADNLSSTHILEERINLIKEELSTNLGLVGLTDINEVDKKIIAEKFFKDIKY